jgi:hypothetical protein
VWGIDKSDHACIRATCTSQSNRGPGIPRIDPSFLDNPLLKQKFIENLEAAIGDANPKWDPHTKLEFLKVTIRGEAFQAMSLMKKSSNEELESTREKIQALMTKNNLDDEEKNELDILNFELEDLLDKQSKKLAQRARLQWIEKGERSNKYFMNLIKTNQQRQMIEAIIKEDGSVTTDLPEIKNEIFKFYKLLYTENKCTTAQNLNLNLVTSEENNELTKPITLEELSKTMNEAKGTTPGPDGIPNEIYKQTWKISGPIILEAWYQSEKTGSLSESQKTAVVCLLEKKGKDKRCINNLRPITLSNCDLKLITKTYTSRINNILNRILETNQTAYLPDRQVHDGLRSIDIIKEECKRGGIEGYLISLDAKKAYDSVSHDFIESTLVSYGFHQKFVKVFRTLYNEISMKVLVNGFQTEQIPIERGVKQGDALSCSLFILLMDIIIRNLKSNINKVSLPQGQVDNVIGYADDLAIIVDNKSKIQTVFNTYEAFSKQSGLYLNADKTEILNLKQYTEHETITIQVYDALFNIPCVDKVKICGKTFSDNPVIEYESNISNQIAKLEKQLKGWDKRNLSRYTKIQWWTHP